MNEKYNIDYQDSTQMWKFQMESLQKADDYAECRNKFAAALKKNYKLFFY